MAEKQNPDCALLGLGIGREILSRTPSFSDWTNKGSITRASRQRSIGLPSPPTSSPMPQNQMGQISIKNEPLSSSSELASLGSLASAWKDWIGPTKPPNNKKMQSQYSSHNQEPAMVPFSRPNPCPSTMENRDQVKLLPKPSDPTRPCWGIKRKRTGSEQFQPPPPSTSNMNKKSADNLLCELCQISCSGALTLQQHLNGRPHKAKLEYNQLKTNCTGKRQWRPRCDVCQIWCSDRAGLDLHYKGQKHKAKLQELELCERNGGEQIAKTPIMCELCHVPCMNEDLYKMHLKGRQHATRDELKRRGML